MSVLVTGAGGSIGKEVLQGLIAAGETVRASSRDPKPGDFPEGVEVVRGDLGEPGSFPEMLSGVRVVFLYANEKAPAEFAQAAREAGVQHVVLLSSHSVLFPNAEKNPIAAMHLNVERTVQESGLDWTFVRPGYLATNTLRWESIRTERVLRTAFPEGSTCLVHERDVAEVAVRALRDEAQRRQGYVIPGAGPLTVREQVATISEALGEPVRLEEVDVPTYRAELVKQVPESLADRLIQLKGQVPQLPDEVRIDAVPQLLGRPALSFAAWAKRTRGRLPIAGWVGADAGVSARFDPGEGSQSCTTTVPAPQRVSSS